jgi:hypothetical protein
MKTPSPCRHRWVRLQRLTRTRMEIPWTRSSTEALSAPSYTWRRRVRTNNSLSSYAHIFRRHWGRRINKLSSRSSGIFDTLLRLGFSTRHLCWVSCQQEIEGSFRPLALYVFSDADFAGCRVNRKLTLGTCQILGSLLFLCLLATLNCSSIYHRGRVCSCL